MKRREIIAAIAGAAGWPLAARAQQSERIRRIVVLMALAESDDTRAHIAKFRQELEKLGWSEGHNGRIAVRFAAGRTDQFQELAKELVNLQPDVILAQSPPIAAAFQRESRAIPIVLCLSPTQLAQASSELGQARGQSHGTVAIRGGHHRQVAGNAQGDRAAPCARRARGQPQNNCN